jgi:hypothetical protein
MDLFKRMKDLSAVYDDDGPSAMVLESRPMFNNGGMLVQPSVDGLRPGYAKVKDKFTVGSGPGTGDALTSDRNTKIVKTALNKIKKQINNKPYFEWSEKSDWYKKLQSKLGGNAEGVGMNRDFTNQLINKVVNENFPGAYHGRSAISNLRKDMVVNGFVEYLKDNGEFDGGEKFLKSLEKFTEGKDIDHKYSEINKAWKSWIAGEFEVEGVDRTQLSKELKARNIDYSKIDNWSANASQKRGLKKKAAIEFLDNQNNKFPNRSFEDVEKLYKQKFPDRNIYLDVNTLTDIKRTGIYKSGDSTTSKYKSVSKGNRANWLKESYGKQFQGNYSKLIKAADQLEAAGESKKAKRISDAADKFFGPNGIITNAKGEGEHALARTFDLLNPDRQLAVNSLVSGDLNQFKKNFFDVPVKRYFDEYNNPETTAARRKELKTLIEDRKKTMNSLTGGQTKGIVAGDTVKFQYTPNKIVATSNVEAIDTAFKKGNFNIDDYVARGTAYSDAFKVAGNKARIFTKTGDIKSTYSKPINETKAIAIQQQIKNQFCPGNRSGGAPGTCDISEAVDNMLKQTNGVKQGTIKGAEATRIANKASKVVRFGTGAGLAKFLGPLGLGAEAVFEVGMAVPGYARGESGKRLLGDSILGLIPGVGQSAEEEFDEYATKSGMSDLEQQKIKDANRFLELNDALTTASNVGVLEGRGAGRGGENQALKLFEKQYKEYEPLYNQFVGGPPSESASTALAEQQRINDLINADKAIRAEQRDIAMDEDFMAAGGGIAKMAGDRSGAMLTSMNPDSQGLSYLFNRVKKV